MDGRDEPGHDEGQDKDGDHTGFADGAGRTLIIRVALDGEASVYRDIEIKATKSLYRLAEAIVSAFGFDFDHAFGFYSGLTDAKMRRVRPIYELFADMGEADAGVLGVKKTKIARRFRRSGIPCCSCSTMATSGGSG